MVAVPTTTKGQAHCYSGSTLRLAESAYSKAYELDATEDATCVDYYFQAATLVWDHVANGHQCPTAANRRGLILYQSALKSLISSGQRFGRFDPSRGLQVRTSNGSLFVPTVYHGFPWQPEDFDAMVPVGNYHTKELNNSYCASGLGIATVVLHRRRAHELFRNGEQAFAATVVLRPTLETDRVSASLFALELFDSVRLSTVSIAGQNVPLKRDITAPFVYRFKDVRRSYLNAFLQPGSTSSETGLFMLEPYQPGKIPVVFVHGLLSDPLTWANIANELHARPDLMERYQLWGFEYATGEPFLTSAALLRQHLSQVQSDFGVSGVDQALSHTVLVGHSMGGLVAKLQVTFSGDEVWRTLANRPFESIVTTLETRRHLASSAFFDPSPMVSRVVYVGSPHRGSPWAMRWIGRIGTSLVEEPSSLQAEHEQLLRDNPDAFYAEFTRRIPTSIDLLRPDSRLLSAIDRLPVATHAKEHSIIGVFRPLIGAGPSDGVVPVASARRPNAVSEKVIRARHSGIHQHPEGIEEIVRILRQHLHEVDRTELTQRTLITMK